MNFARRHRRILLFTASVITVLLLAFVSFRIVISRKVAARLTAIQTQGYPVTLAQLNKWYAEPPQGENAADYYMAAFGRYSRFDLKGLPSTFDPKTLPQLGEDLPSAVKATLQQTVEANRESLELLHRASAMQQCRFPTDFTTAYQLPPNCLDFAGWRDSPAHFSGCYYAMQGPLQWEALLNADNRDAEGGTRSILALLAVARALNEEPLLGNQALRTNTQIAAVNCLERLMCRVALSKEQLLRLDAGLKDALDMSGLHRAAIAQRCIGSAAFTDRAARDRLWTLMATWARGGKPARINTAYLKLRSCLGLLEIEHLHFLNAMQIYISETAQVKATDAQISLPCPQFAPLQTEETSRLRTLRSPFLMWFLIQQPFMDGTFRESVPRLQLARSAVAIESYRAEHSIMPTDTEASTKMTLPKMTCEVQSKGYLLKLSATAAKSNKTTRVRKLPQKELLFQVLR